MEGLRQSLCPGQTQTAETRKLVAPVTRHTIHHSECVECKELKRRERFKKEGEKGVISKEESGKVDYFLRRRFERAYFAWR